LFKDDRSRFPGLSASISLQRESGVVTETQQSRHDLPPSPESPRAARTAGNRVLHVRRARGLGLLGLLLLTLGLALGNVRADSYDERRVRSAARLMRALLAADEGLVSRHPDGADVQVLILARNERKASPLGDLIAPTQNAEPSQVSGLKLSVATRPSLPEADTPAPDAIFLAEPLDTRDFTTLLFWCIDHRVILYSPFEGDVERGATAGLSIQAKVQPFVNRETLTASGIQLRAFFLDHSRVWP